MKTLIIKFLIYLKLNQNFQLLFIPVAAFSEVMCIGLLCSLVPFRRKKKKGGKPESFLTPFEREMVPMLLKELHSANSRFYEVVCFRWYKEASAISEVNDEQS